MSNCLWGGNGVQRNNDIDGHHHTPLSLSREGGVSRLFWATITTPSSLAPNARGGGSPSFWVHTPPPPLSPGGGSQYVLSDYRPPPPPSLSCERGGFLVCSG